MQSVEQILHDLLAECVADIRRRFMASGKNVTGRTIASLESGTEQTGGGDITGRISGARYFGAMETGRGPYNGGPSSQGEFLRNLTQWCAMRGVPSQGLTEEQYRRFAGYLRWRINKLGTRLYRQGGRKDIFTPPVEDFQRRLGERVLLFYQREVQNLFTKGFQGFGRQL